MVDPDNRGGAPAPHAERRSTVQRTVTLIAIAALAAPVAWAAKPAPTPTPPRDTAVYQPRYHDPVLKEIFEKDKARDAKAEAETKAIRARQKQEKEDARKQQQVLRFDMSKLVKPASPDAFTSAWHFPPVAQYLTGTCWSFSTTSFYESEIHRLTGQEIRLSPIWTVYWEYVEKMRRFVAERGDSLVGEGSESNAVPRIWKEYGVVPEEAYAGVLSPDGRHDHSRLIARLHDLCDWLKANEIWDEHLVVAMTRDILDEELGAPPQEVTWQGATYTPLEFLHKVTRLNLDDYAELMSTLSIPFYTKGEYKAPDNWWHSKDYYNVPLDVWYSTLVRLVQHGYTVAIGGDVSEPGINGFEDAAIIPSFDIPQNYIDQSSREFRFANGTTADDHGIHLVGMTRTPDGHEWFLIKDSARASRWGKFPGYFFYRDDYVKLKMLTYTAPREALKDLLAKFNEK
jgi:bleomycin hydrolase